MGLLLLVTFLLLLSLPLGGWKSLSLGKPKKLHFSFIFLRFIFTEGFKVRLQGAEKQTVEGGACISEAEAGG